MDHIIRGSSEELGYDRELVHVVFPWKQWFTLKHFRKNTACTPDIHLHIILLPCKHNFRRPIVPGRHVTGHLRILYPRKAKVADLQIAVLIDKDIAGLEVPMYDTSRMNIFETALQQVRHHSIGRDVLYKSHIPGFGIGNTV